MATLALLSESADSYGDFLQFKGPYLGENPLAVVWDLNYNACGNGMLKVTF